MLTATTILLSIIKTTLFVNTVEIIASFVYNSNGGGSGSDMPASMATLAGFFAPDDSPAAQAKFNDMYTTMNR